jgi:hypothetical protein
MQAKAGGWRESTRTRTAARTGARPAQNPYSWQVLEGMKAHGARAGRARWLCTSMRVCHAGPGRGHGRAAAPHTLAAVGEGCHGWCVRVAGLEVAKHHRAGPLGWAGCCSRARHMAAQAAEKPPCRVTRFQSPKGHSPAPDPTSCPQGAGHLRHPQPTAQPQEASPCK